MQLTPFAIWKFAKDVARFNLNLLFGHWLFDYWLLFGYCNLVIGYSFPKQGGFMQSIIILSVSIVLFALAYFFYSPFVARRLGLEPDRPTPAHTMTDDVDYYPAKMPILFGHHFASIAGAAPIVGPIIAVVYGWGAVLLWIVLGGIFLGAVHDFSALVASVRHGGRSMGEVIGVHLGRSGKMIFLFFLWAAMILLIAVYLVIVATTFSSVPAAGTAASLFIPLAILFGIAVYKMRCSVLLASILGILFLTACMAAGWFVPLNLPVNIWMYLLIIYIFAASVTPVWILLQPRDYLNSFLLYGLLLSAIVGIFVSWPEIRHPFFTEWLNPELGPLFPILFVTVACGAISGFHSVVAGGTTSKQINKEGDARPIGYGAMLVESLLAVIALIVAMHLSQSEYAAAITAKGPVTIFSENLGAFLSKFGFSSLPATTFAALAVSAFVLTTLDTATRLARFAFQEFFASIDRNWILARNRYIGTTITVAIAAVFAFSGRWKAIWPVFGSANQLLAALALLAVTLWLKSKGRKTDFLKIPMVIMFVITLCALAVIVWQNINVGHYALAVCAAVLLVIAVVLVIRAFPCFVKKGERR
jgi:carbon starvation protein